MPSPSNAQGSDGQKRVNGRALTLSLIEILIHGGCYWKRDRDDRPGHSIAIANGTLSPRPLVAELAAEHRLARFRRCHDKA